MAESGNCQIDDIGLYIFSPLVAEAKAVEHPRFKILGDGVGAFGEAPHDFLRFRRLQVERERTLTIIYAHEAGATARVRPDVPRGEHPHLVADLGDFDLDNVRAEQCHLCRRHGPAQDLREIDDADSFKCFCHGAILFAVKVKFAAVVYESGFKGIKSVFV